MSEFLEILNVADEQTLGGVLVQGKNPSNGTSSGDVSTGFPIADLVNTLPGSSTRAPGGGSRNTLFSLISPATTEPGGRMQESLASSVTGTIRDIADSTLNEVNKLVTDGVRYDASTGFVASTTAAYVNALYNTTTPGGGMFGNSTMFPSTISTDSMDMSIAAMETERAEYLRVVLWQWMSPFIFLFGMFGNIAILIVLATRPVMSDNTTSTYVRWLAVADLLTLITGVIPEWLAFCGIFNVEEVHPVSCKFYKFFAYTASDASIWILAAFSLERFIAVVFPFKRQKGWCKVSQVKIICVVLIMTGVAKNLQSFFTRGAEFIQEGGENGTLVLRSNCGYPTAADRYFNLYIRPWLVLVSINIIPMIILWFCNFTVIWTISRRRTIQRGLQISSASKRANALTQQVTIMCLCASFSFIVFMTPSFILFIGKAYWAYDPASRGPYLIAKAVNNQLMYINNSINFYLYLFSGERFRDSVISIFIKCQWSKAVRDARSQSMRPTSSAANSGSKINRNRKGDPYESTVLTNNGFRTTSSPAGSTGETPLGSRENLNSKNRF